MIINVTIIDTITQDEMVKLVKEVNDNGIILFSVNFYYTTFAIDEEFEDNLCNLLEDNKLEIMSANR